MILGKRLLFKCFLRSYFVGAAYNPRGLQNVGFLYAIEPGLVAIYGEGPELRRARMRYAKQFNSHPFFTPMLLGAYLRMEQGIAEGRFSPHSFVNFKDTAANALSAIGDSFFNGSCLTAWALCSSLFICRGMPMAAFALSVALLVGVQLFKVATFLMGCKMGMAFLFFMKRLDLINWGERLKCINAILLTAFLWFALPDARALPWMLVAVSLLLGGWIIGKLHANRVILALVILIVIVALEAAGYLQVFPEDLFVLGIESQGFIIR